MAQRKTVLLFETLYPKQIGGMEVYNYHLANNLLAMDNSPFILLTGMKEQVDNKSTFFVSSRMFGITRWGLGYLSIFLYCIFSSKIRIRNWDTVMIPYTSNFDFNAWPVIVFSKLLGFKYSIHCHGGGLKQWKYPRLQKCLFRNASHVAAVSDSIVKDYSQRVGFPLDYLPPLVRFTKSCMSVSELKQKYNLSAYEKIVLYVGSIKPLKSPETLLEGFKRLDSELKNNVKACLVFAGDGPLRQSLENEYKSERNIRFLGNIPNSEVNEMFAIADIYVLCSWYEGTSVSLLEAMYNHCSCIGTDVQGINDMITNGENGILIPKDGIREMTDALASLLTNPARANELGNAANKFYAQNYSYEKHIDDIRSFLNIVN